MDDHNKENEIVRELKEDWESLDMIAGTPQMTKHEVYAQLHVFKQNRKRAFRKELSLFILTAIFILSLFVATLLKSVQTLVYIQVIVAVIAPVIYVFLRKREGKVWE